MSRFTEIGIVSIAAGIGLGILTHISTEGNATPTVTPTPTIETPKARAVTIPASEITIIPISTPIPSRSQELPTSTRTPIPYSTAVLNNPTIDKYYPETRGLPLKEIRLITTNSGTDIKFYNFTPMTFNPDTARRTFNYFQGFMRGDQVFPSAWDTIPFGIIPKPRFRPLELPVFVVPENIKSPSRFDFIYPKLGWYPFAGTALDAQGVATFSFIRTPLWTSSEVENDTSISVAIEACQTSVYMGFTPDTILPKVNPQQFVDDIQENFCNRWGKAFVYKQVGYLHKDLPTDGISHYVNSKPIKITEKQYDSIPRIAPVFTYP